MELSLIVALDEKKGIGKNGKLPWNIPEDMKYFKKTTSTVKDKNKKNAIIMGSKTRESIPEKFRPLKDRINIVLTKDEKKIYPEGVLKFDSIEKAKKYIKNNQQIEKAIIIGGGSIYKQIMEDNELKTLYITEINGEYDCDTFFPEYNNKFREIYRERFEKRDYVIYQKK